MTMNDLEFGDIVTTRTGEKWAVADGYLYSEKGKVFCFDYIDDDLKNIGVCGCDWDIMKVERYELIPSKSDNTKFYELKTIYERKDILDDKEKEYLSVVIKPFRDKILSIEKSESVTFKNCTYIRIRYLDKLLGEQISSLPYFKKNTMYKGMELNNKYSLEELGL